MDLDIMKNSHLLLVVGRTPISARNPASNPARADKFLVLARARQVRTSAASTPYDTFTRNYNIGERSSIGH